MVRASNAQADAVDVPAATAPLQVRGRFLTAVVVPVPAGSRAAFLAGLDAALAQSPHFFSNAPLVLDVAEAEGLDTADGLAGLADDLRQRALTPLGLQNATPAQAAAAAALGLTSLQGGRDSPLETRARPVDPEPEPDVAPAGTLIVTEPVRSGQRIHAQDGDLVVIASVSSGAELIARGNVHVYGRLRGRALAGVNGDRSARIFCQCLDAELIAIAGLYKTSDGFGAAVARQRVQAFLEGDALRIEALG